MKIIDYQSKGNVIRFYLGNDSLDNWWGDDWDDRPYEHNAGIVYSKFITSHRDISRDFDEIVLEPKYNSQNSAYCKNDMQERKIPIIVVVSKEVFKEIDDAHKWDASFSDFALDPRTIKYFMGDQI